ncbi:MAG: hypothetical protein EA392_03530 [Cryomorphaceae bacterium]|nr:MAG: hypothetical protein EA392_03530 [Cryomorphaceae bacterium]
MKIIVLILVSLVVTVGSLSAQISNEERLAQIEREMSEAVSSGDYELAAKLKREKELRLQIKDAIDQKDYARAAELKEKLDGTNQKASPRVKAEAPGPERKLTEQTSDDASQSTATPRWVPLNNLTWYRATKSGFYINGLFGGIDHWNVRGVSSGLRPGFSFAGGGRIGSKFFFGEKERRSRVGLDLMYISAIGSDWGAQLGIGNIGLTWAGAFTRKSGIEFTLLGGTNIFLDYFGIMEQVRMGLCVSPQMKFRFSFFDLGATVIYSNPFGYNLESVIVGAIVGFKF